MSSDTEAILDAENVRIGRRVRARMGTQCVSQEAIGQLLGLSQPQVHQRLEGRVAFRIGELIKVAEKLDTTVTKLTG